MRFVHYTTFFLISLFFTDVFSKNKNARFSIGTGIYNFMENGKSRCKNPLIDGTCTTADLEEHKSASIAYNLEYFTKKKVLKYINPFLGFLGTTDSAYYGYFGLSGDLFFLRCKCIVITPSLAAGWYLDGEDIKLGNRIQFKSGGDITYKFKNQVRVGLGIFHISNANLGDENPGSEQIIFKYQIPLK
tara:strand:+ start:34662 stop:35225 length:564 start_codon:yes stop_codon:yes gene_type:complete